MGRWLMEMKENVGDDVVLHVVGTKSDVIAQDPNLRRIPFERCIAYVAENLYAEQVPTPPATAGAGSGVQSLDGTSKRSSGFWGQELGWDCCHEISASSGEGIEEVFRVITRKLVEKKDKKDKKDKKAQLELAPNGTPGHERTQVGYFDGPGSDGYSSFRLTAGDKRKSWLGFPTPNIGIGDEGDADTHGKAKGRKGKCC